MINHQLQRLTIANHHNLILKHTLAIIFAVAGPTMVNPPDLIGRQCSPSSIIKLIKNKPSVDGYAKPYADIQPFTGKEWSKIQSVTDATGLLTILFVKVWALTVFREGSQTGAPELSDHRGRAIGCRLLWRSCAVDASRSAQHLAGHLRGPRRGEGHFGAYVLDIVYTGGSIAQDKFDFV